MADQTRCLFIVSREQLRGRDVLTAVQASVRPEDHLEVIVDRRRGGSPSEWQGAEDRRKRPQVDLALQTYGVAVVPAAVPGDERRPEPPPGEETSRQLFEDRRVGREIPLHERSVRAERGPLSLLVPSRLASQVATAPVDSQPGRYEDNDDDEERFEAIRSFQRERSRRLLLPWTIAGLAVVAAAVVVLSPLAHSLKPSVAPPAPSDVTRPSSQPAAPARDTAHAPRAPAANKPSIVDPLPREASSEAPPAEQSPRTTGPAAGGAAENSPPLAPQTATGTTAGRRARSSADAQPGVNEPAPRLADPDPSPSRPMSRLTSPRFAGLPHVDVSREPGSTNAIYTARIIDPAGRPLGDAYVLLLARMSDGTVENVMMHFSPERGTYRGALPPTRSPLVDLRVRVITGDKRIEIPVGP